MAEKNICGAKSIFCVKYVDREQRWTRANPLKSFLSFSSPSDSSPLDPHPSSVLQQMSGWLTIYLSAAPCRLRKHLIDSLFGGGLCERRVLMWKSIVCDNAIRSGWRLWDQTLKDCSRPASSSIWGIVQSRNKTSCQINQSKLVC